jgi:hypothetical protein
MAGLRFTDLQARPTEFLDGTRLTLDALQQLVPPCEAAFQAQMAAGRLDGTPRTARQCAVSRPCPLPTPEERLWLLFASIKTSALHVGQGRRFGMGPRHAPPGMPVLLPVLLAARRTLGAAPARSRTALAPRLGVSEADAATGGAPLAEAAAAGAAVPATASAAPLWPRTGPHGGSSAPKTLWNRRGVIVARKRTIRSKRSWGSRRCASSLASAPPRAVASMPSPWLPRRRLPGPPGAGGCRRWASWR